MGHNTILEFLSKKGFEVENNPNAKLTPEQVALLSKEFASSATEKLEASGLSIGVKHNDAVQTEKEKEASVKKRVEEEETSIMIKNLGSKDLKAKEEAKPEKVEREKAKLEGIKVLGKIELEKKPVAPVKEEEKVEVKAPEPPPVVVAEVKPPKEIKVEKPEVVAPPPVVVAKPEVIEEKPEQELIKGRADKLQGLKVLDRIQLPEKKKDAPVASSDTQKDAKAKRPRKRIATEPGQGGGQTPAQNDPRRPMHPGGGQQRRGPHGPPPPRIQKAEPTEKEIQDQIKATLAKLSGGGNKKASGAKYRREKRQANFDAQEQQMLQDQEASKTLKVTEFISANDLSSMMNVSVNDVISTCLSLGMFVSINQRLDAEAITFIADEFGFEVAFISAEEEVQNDVQEEVDDEASLQERAPIVTIMGHVDHGKTSLLDYIRQENVASGEAGGITQHIGAYSVKTKTGKQVTFLDTPGHEAFTAMRARGAKVTDVVIIVIAADDSVMPQTREAINHAQVAGVPIVFAFSKVDKAGANTEKIREELANMNLLVEEWGGKYQTQEISSKSGLGIDELLEKVLLEAELLELKANPNRRAMGTVVEASLDKGRGYVTTILVQTGTLKVGDVVLAGAHFGKVKAMTDYLGKKLKTAGPSTPVQLLGLNGAPQAGDRFNVFENERDARDIATKREQIQREQSIRTRKHITLEEIGRRKAIGTFRELNLIVKGDVDGSVEALSDSLLQLSTSEVQVNIIHKAVGQISESDVNLAIASDAIIVGFQVRPSSNAKKMAEQDQIEIRHYSVIYQAIEEIKDAMTGMLAPTIEEIITGNIEIREVFKISRIGTIAGCYVTDGYVKRNNKIRVVRDGIVLYTGEIDSLKRYKDDVQEVRNGYECGLSVKNYNDIEIGDIIESFELREVKRTL